MFENLKPLQNFFLIAIVVVVTAVAFYKGKKINEKTGRVAKHYRCASCGGEFTSSNIEVDHISPVVDPDIGFIDWNTFIDRLYCPKENLQVLCTSCHKEKTNEERKKTADSADEKLFEYLRENIKPRNIAKKNVQRIETLPFNHKLLITKELIYDYYSERYEQTGQTSFKVLSVIDKAVAFLLFNKLVTSNELAQFR